ncbi:type II secretion system F family protein [Nocardiopsis sp. NPDC058631]|uniref:type II secretion system F family protein n=1 Tax=Nocardiopsis sp. NPDC058631 TaxID=3346566 RepID=UPI00365A91D9
MTTVLPAGLGGAAVGLGLVLLLPTLTLALTGVRTRVNPGRHLLWKGTAAAGAGILTWGFTGWPVAAAMACAAAWWLPAVLGPDRATPAEVARIEAVAGWTEQLRDLITASAGLRQAISASADIAPDAIRDDVRALARDLTNGTDLEEALTALAHRVDNETADLVTTALSMASHRHAADLGPLLTSLAEAARDRAAMLVRTSASRARTRTSVRIIVTTATAMVVGMALVNGPYFAPLDSAGGQLVLALAGTVWSAALGWLLHLSNPPRAQRVLSAHPQESRT